MYQLNLELRYMKKLLNSNYKILVEQQLMIEVVEGIITPGSLMNLKIIELQDKDFSPSYNVIGDVRNTTFDITTSQIEAFVNFIVANKDSFAINKSAIIFSTINQQIYISILKSFQSEFPQSLKICTSLDEALAWVGSDIYQTLITSEFEKLKKNLKIKWVYDSDF